MPLHLLQRRDADAWKSREQSRQDAIAKLRQAQREHLAGQAMWVYGSILDRGKFRRHSDIDVALERSPEGVSLYALQSLLTEATGHAIDISLLDETRLRRKIEMSGQRWTGSG